MTIETLDNQDPNHLKNLNSSQQTNTQNESYFLKINSNFTNLKITINHWQLRDLVQSSSTEPNKILFTCKDQLRSYDYKTHKITNYCKLDFQPRCFAEQDGILISGGVASKNGTNNHNHNHHHSHQNFITSSSVQNEINNISLSSSSSSSSSASINNNNNNINHSKGLLNIHNKELNIDSTVNVGSLINNNVSLDKVSNYKYHSLVSNNDYCLYSCDIENNGKVDIKDVVNLGFAVNHASLSPDKHMIVACGDSKRIVLLHQDSGYNNISSTSNKLFSSSSSSNIPSHKKVSLKTSYDSGISTAFSNDGKFFSCAFQDGITVVYDVRNYKKPLHTIYSTRPRAQHGAFRCCKFSGGTDDFLIISEHTGRVHLVDTRNFEKHQVVLLPKLIYSPGGAGDHGVYHEPLVREYQDALTSFNGFSDSNIRYNVNSEYLYLSNGILSDNNRADLQQQQQQQQQNHHHHYHYNQHQQQQYLQDNNMDMDSVNFDDDCDPHGGLSNLDVMTDDWSEMDQETNIDSQLESDQFYTNSNNIFSVNNHFTGRRVSFSRSHDDNSEYRLMYDDSLVDINGVDWYCDPDTGKSHLLVGCDKGLFRWDVDSWSRRCFPTYEIC